MTDSRPPLRFRGDRFTVERVRYAGRDGTPVERDVIRHPGAVVVIPRGADGRVLFVENYRPAVGATLLELPAGTRDPAETPEATARRELTEETGLTAERLTEVVRFHVSPGILDEEMIVYLAEGLTEGEPSPEETERLTPRWLTPAEAWAELMARPHRDAKTLLGLVWLGQRPDETV